MYVKVFNDMNDSEKRQILRLLQRLNSKRRRDQKPRLEYVVDFRFGTASTLSKSSQVSGSYDLHPSIDIEAGMISSSSISPSSMEREIVSHPLLRTSWITERSSDTFTTIVSFILCLIS